MEPFVFRACRQLRHPPSPAERGRVGEGVGDVVDESKFRFFNGLLPSPQPLSHCVSCSSPRGTSIAGVAREGLVRRIVNSP